MRKRINNDFDALVEVLHEGVKIDLSLYEITSVRMVSSQAYKVTDYEVRNGSLFLHVTPLIVPKPGKYKIVVTYRMADPTLADGFWNFEFDKYLVTIVGSSEEEDAGEVVITADAVIGMQGKSAYQVWLDEGNTGTVEDFLEWVQSPANEVIASVQEVENIALYNETLRATAEGLRVTAENNRNNAEGLRLSAEIIRNDNEADRIEAEGLRAGAETGRQTAEGLRQQAESKRQSDTSTAIFNAEQATDDANDAATNANNVANTYADELALKASHGYASNPKTLKQVDDNLVQLAGEVGQNKNLLTQSYAPNVNFIKYFPQLFSLMLKTPEGLLFTSGYAESWTATIPKYAGKIAIIFDGIVSGIESPTDKIRFLIQYTGYSAYIDIAQNIDGTHVLREVDFNENIANITLIRMYIGGNAKALVRNMYVGNKDRYNEPTLLQYEIDNPTLTVDNLMYLGENKSMLLPNPHDVAVSFEEVLDVSKYTTIYFRADISSVGADVNVTNFTITNADNNQNAISPYPLFRHQGTRGYGYFSINVSSINRLRITASGQGLLHELVASESIMTNKTKAVKSFGTYMLLNKNVKLTHLINDTPVNILPNNGLIKYGIYIGSRVSFIDDGFVRFTGSSLNLIYQVEPADYDRYISVVNAKNITGNPKIGYRNSPSEIIFYTIIPGVSYKLPANRTEIYINASGGSIDIKQVYLGDNPYNEDWVENIPVTAETNFFENVDLNGYENVITDEDDNKVIRIQGDGTRKGVNIKFDKVIENGYFSLQFRTNSERIEYRTVHIASNGADHNPIIYENQKVYPDINHIIGREFSASFPRGGLSVYFTGSESDYIEVLLPAITKNSIDILTTELINKYSSDKEGTTGIAEFDIASDILAKNPSGLIKVGEYLLSKKKESPTSKLDFECVNGSKPSVVSKLQDIRYVDTGNWTLVLVTTKKRFIFTNSATNQTSYTDNLEECLIPTEFVGERRFTLDDTKLISMLNKLSVGVRELSDGELVFWTYETQHYTTDGQTQVHESGVVPASVGSRINGWAYDAYDDTVVYSTYSPSPNYGLGSIILSLDGGRTYFESFNVETDGPALLGSTYVLCHIHGVFIDQYRDALIALVGDYSFDEVANGKILVLENYRSNTQWRLIERNFEKISAGEQYCTGIALPKANLYGSDMHETCIARQAIGIKGLDTPREWADQLHIGLDYIPNFTRPIEPGAPVGIHYSYTGAANPNVPPSSILLTKDGFYFPVIYTDNVAHSSFGNNNARVWCDNSGNVYCTQFGGRFARSLIIGKYNGYNSI